MFMVIVIVDLLKRSILKICINGTEFGVSGVRAQAQDNPNKRFSEKVLIAEFKN